MARNIGVNFAGKHIIHPGVYSQVDSAALSTLSNVNSRLIVFVGSSDGGEPDKIHWLSNPSEARDVLRGGDLLKAGELAWSPSSDGVGAGTIGFLRVDSATQSTLTVGNMKFTSLDYGAHTNKIQIKMENGSSLPGSKKITVYFWEDDVTEVYDNLGPIFDIQYTGSDAYAVLNITKDENGNAKLLEIKTGADAGSATTLVSYNLGDGQWSDVTRLVYDLDSHADITATMKTVGNKNVDTSKLDAVNNQDIKTAQYTVTALQGDIENQLAMSRLVKVEFINGTFPSNFDFTYMSGGSNGTVPASWASKFDLIFGSGAYFVVPLTADPAIHAEALRFVDTQEVNEGNFMMTILGGGLNETVDQVIGRALSLASARAVLCYPGIIRSFSTGTTETLPPYFTAAMIAGRLAGKDTGDPITLDYLNLVGVEKILTRADIERLLQNGVLAIEYVRRANSPGYRIAQGITTYQKDSNPSYREIGMRMIVDELISELTEILETKFAGGKGTASALSLIKNETQSFLDRKVREEVIVEYDPDSVNVTIQGDVVYVTYSAVPVNSINYILVTARLSQTQLQA